VAAAIGDGAQRGRPIQQQRLVRPAQIVKGASLWKPSCGARRLKVSCRGPGSRQLGKREVAFRARETSGQSSGSLIRDRSMRPAIGYSGSEAKVTLPLGGKYPLSGHRRS